MDWAHKLLVFSIVALMLIPSAQALQFGSVAKKSTVTIEPGAQGQFDLLLWNTEHVSYTVSFTTQQPQGWIVIVEPDSFELSDNPDPPIELLSLPYKENVVAKRISILFSVPQTAQSGTYTITAHALAETQGTGISLFQERDFVFTIIIPGTTASARRNNPFLEPIVGVLEGLGGITGAVTQKPENSINLGILLLLGIIGLFAYRRRGQLYDLFVKKSNA